MSEGVSQEEGMKKQGWCSNVACVIEEELGRPRGSQGRTTQPSEALIDQET